MDGGLPLMAGAIGLVGAILPMSVVAAAAAYQRNRQGKAPTWYRTVAKPPDDHRLDKLYLPRPGWKIAPRVLAVRW